jgi:cobalt-zinc-cadmium efflux system membrane fusion protein
MGVTLGVVATLGVQHYIGADLGTQEEEAVEPRGPHGGRLLTSDRIVLEATIFEEGVPPHYRVYPTTPAGRPIRPVDVRLTVALERLGGQVDRLEFIPEVDYLRSTGVVEEPHSFVAKFTAVYEGQSVAVSYEQVEGRATIPDAALASTGIQLATAGPGTLSSRVELPGGVTVPPGRRVSVAPRVEGVLVEQRATIGQRVARGDTVAVFTSPELAAASSAYVTAVARAEFARTTRDREEDLARRRITAMHDFQVAEQAHALARAELDAAREALSGLGLSSAVIDGLPKADPATFSRLLIAAPIDGLVTERTAAPGERVSRDTSLLVITNTSEVWVNVQVHARDLDAVRPGRRVAVSAVGLPRTATGAIAAINPLMGDETRTATARVVLPNPDGRWQPGLFVSVAVDVGETNADIVVPTEALQMFRDWTVVFVRYGDVFEARPVTLGRTDGRSVEIVSGLRAGERFAAVNAFAVKADVLKSGASHDH